MKRAESFFTLASLWLGLNAIPFLLGIMEGGHDYETLRNSCDKPISRIEYIMPGFQLGCFMGKSPKAKSDSLQLCENYCDSAGEDFSKVLQMSYGTCICKNEEGANVSEGYMEFSNGQCEGHKK